MERCGRDLSRRIASLSARSPGRDSLVCTSGSRGHIIARKRARKRVPCTKRDEPESTHLLRSRRATAFFESLGVSHSVARAILSRCCDHLLAILVNQGSDPKVPYQALVIRESARLFLGFAPWGQKAFSAREPAAAESTPPTRTILPRRLPGVPTPPAGCRRAGADRGARPAGSPR